MGPEPGAVFVFGKLPAHGDFVSRGLSDAAREAWDSWATAALERLRDGHPDFEDAHDAAAPWRFVAGPSTLGPGWRAGALAASAGFPWSPKAGRPGAMHLSGRVMRLTRPEHSPAQSTRPRCGPASAVTRLGRRSVLA